MSVFTKPPSEIVELVDPWLQLTDGNRVFTTLEGQNPGGSMKDHMVRGELEDLVRKKRLQKGDSISEVSAGSTAAALAHYCPLYGLKCVLFVPSVAPAHLLSALKSQGAEIHVEEMKSIYEAYDQFIAKHPGIRRFDQLFDSSKRRHYHSFGQEILNSLGRVDVIVGSVGTGHSLLGTAEGMGRPLIVSAEPGASLRIPGVRNVDLERYGQNDTCRGDDFDRRIIAEVSDLPGNLQIMTARGPIQATASFQLVLAALKIFLKDKENLRIFAMGAALKHLEKAKETAA